MTVLFGNTPDAYTVGASGAVQAGVVVQFYTDAARTVPATGLTDEDGSPSDSALPSQQGRVIGSTVTSKANGVLSFGAPDGTAKLYYNRGDGVSGVLGPRTDTAYAPRPSGTPSAGKVPVAIDGTGATQWATPASGGGSATVDPADPGALILTGGSTSVDPSDPGSILIGG